MLETIDEQSVARLKNSRMRAYCRDYFDRERDYMDQVASLGLPFAERRRSEEDVRADIASLVSCAASVSCENDARSVRRGDISPACLSCRTRARTATLLISTRCPRNCWFCFNENQQGYERLRSTPNDVVAELERYYAQGAVFDDLTLTGGEPLLHKGEVERFLRRAKELYPQVRTRLYTSGSFLDGECAHMLACAGLDEIRFSIKTDDPAEELDRTFARIGLVCGRIGRTMVEMPVMPDEVDLMRDLLLRLDGMGVWGINLLELCYPLHNAAEYARRGYRLKNPPHPQLPRQRAVAARGLDQSRVHLSRRRSREGHRRRRHRRCE